ncbi:hypothetical protein [Shewanella algae]|uniref:hypothetical protein n=1 Tax=Shewanella algae TaxID=38313 RepID=UPI0031F4F50C
MSPQDQLTTNINNFISEIKSDRKNWRILMIPQLVFLFVLVFTLAAITVGGFYVSVQALWNGADISTVEKSAKVFVTGSSSVLGFILIKIFGLLKDVGEKFIAEEKAFTGHLNMARLSTQDTELKQVVTTYHNI